MTVSAIDTFVRAAGNGSTTIYNFEFKIFDGTDLVVQDITDADLSAVTLVFETDYQVFVSATEEGGNVTLTTPLASGHTLDIRSNIPLAQPEDIRNQGRFLPELHEGVFDRLARQIQDGRRFTDSAIRIPDDEVLQSDWDTMLAVNTRKGKYLGHFNDTTGALELYSSIGSTILTQSLIGSFLDAGFLGSYLYAQTPSKVAATVTPTSYQYLPDVPVIDARRYGAVLDDSTDDFLAISKAIQVAGIIGGRVLIAGKAAVSSTNVSGGALFTVPGNVEIVGLSRITSAIRITGTTAGHLFKVSNGKSIRVADISLTGNNTSAGFSDSSCFYALQDSSASSVGGNFIIENCAISNFKGDYWLWFRNTGATYEMQNIWVRNNVFTSLSGNSRAPTLLAVPDAFVVIHGAGSNATGIVRNAWVVNNSGDCTYKKMFGIAWETTVNVWFASNYALNCGANASADAGGYAFMAYDNSPSDGGPGGFPPDYIYFIENRIEAPKSCGIYISNGGRTYCRGNRINGQSDTSDVTLPKAGIAVNNSQYAEVDGNYIDDCYGGITLISSTNATGYYIGRNNRVTATKANGYGITARATFAGLTQGFELVGNSVYATGATCRGIWLRFTATFGTSKLIVCDNTVTGTDRVIEMYADDATVPNLVNVNISFNRIFGLAANFGLLYPNCNNTGTRARIGNNVMGGTWAAAGIILKVTGSFGLTLVENEMQDMTTGTGFAWQADSARGRAWGNRFNNVSSARQVNVTGSEDLGYDAPTWTGVLNDMVQDMGAVEAGSAASKYVNQGYRYDGTAWRQMRMLTGN